MTSLLTLSTDLGELAHRLKLRPQQVEAVVAMLDDGNTVPFITRYRKDQTGGLDEEQIRSIQEELRRLRQLTERKQTILRSIEAQDDHLGAVGTERRRQRRQHQQCQDETTLGA